MRSTPFCIACVLLPLLCTAAGAAVLPEDRADLMYHRYSGGGITVQGPSVLVRKSIGESFSASANYYVDAISSASVDVVVSGASRYSEKRTQKSVGVDYLRGKSMWSAFYMESAENDYKATTWSLGVSQEMFGDLTTVSFGYSKGRDRIGDSTDPSFSDEIDRRNYRVGVTQILTRSSLLSLNFETVTEQGYLQNPYRSMRYLNLSGTWTSDSEVFPRTRTSNAASARYKHYLPWRASAEAHYRFFSDTWGIRAHTAGLEYTHPLKIGPWTLTGSWRYYQQNSADFFSDLFPYEDAQNFMARDKETSALSGHTLGIGATYEFPMTTVPGFKKGSVTMHVSRMMLDYDEFRDLRGLPPGSVPPGTEPLYSLDASVFQFYVSFWF